MFLCIFFSMHLIPVNKLFWMNIVVGEWLHYEIPDSWKNCRKRNICPNQSLNSMCPFTEVNLRKLFLFKENIFETIHEEQCVIISNTKKMIQSPCWGWENVAWFWSIYGMTDLPFKKMWPCGALNQQKINYSVSEIQEKKVLLKTRTNFPSENIHLLFKQALGLGEGGGG